jgi:hypothetical protein
VNLSQILKQGLDSNGHFACELTSITALIVLISSLLEPSSPDPGKRQNDIDKVLNWVRFLVCTTAFVHMVFDNFAEESIHPRHTNNTAHRVFRHNIIAARHDPAVLFDVNYNVVATTPKSSCTEPQGLWV